MCVCALLLILPWCCLCYLLALVSTWIKKLYYTKQWMRSNNNNNDYIVVVRGMRNWNDDMTADGGGGDSICSNSDGTRYKKKKKQPEEEMPWFAFTKMIRNDSNGDDDMYYCTQYSVKFFKIVNWGPLPFARQSILMCLIYWVRRAFNFVTVHLSYYHRFALCFSLNLIRSVSKLYILFFLLILCLSLHRLSASRFFFVWLFQYYCLTSSSSLSLLNVFALCVQWHVRSFIHSLIHFLLVSCCCCFLN